MYGLSYCKLDVDYMYDLDLLVLSKLIKAEMDKEVHQYDLEMRRIAWQTAYLMNSTGNYKRPVKPDKLYTPMEERNQIQLDEITKQENIQAKREELLKTFDIKR